MGQCSRGGAARGLAGTTEHTAASPEDLLNRAWAAVGAQDWDEAARRWQAMRQHHPERWEGHVWPVHTLWLAGRLDEAEATAAEAAERFPENTELLRLRAVVATGRQCWDAALELWRIWRDRVPDDPDGYTWPMRILWQNRRAVPEELAEESVARFPDNPDVLAQRAFLCMAQQRWNESLPWWAAVREHGPQRVDGYVWASQALRQAGRLDEAEAQTADAVVRFPADAEVLVEHAQVAMARSDHEEALRRWAVVRERFPENSEAYTAPLTILRLSGRAQQAEAMAAEVLTRFPGNPAAILEQLQVAASRADPQEALHRLAAARGVIEESGRMESGLGWIEYRLRLQTASPDQPVAPDEASADAATPEPSVAKLMLAFESLGERCDFGAVQRKYGVEPLGLLRFALAPFEGLVAALDDGFAAVGSEQDTEFSAYLAEHMIEMKRYGLTFHTCVYHAELADADFAAFRRQQLRRLVFLKRKLLADLEEAEKIFVYSDPRRTADADALTLFGALGRYGPNALLFVRPADDRHPPGAVEVLQERLLVGYVDRFTRFGAGELPPYETWRRLCETTLRLARDG